MKHLYVFPLLCLIFSVSFSSYSQNNFSGSVRNVQQQAIPFANVVLMETDSVTVYKGAVTDEQGEFSFENILSKEYVLVVSYVGYAPTIRKIEVSQDSRMEPIVLNEDADFLTEVTINARKPRVIRQIDRLVFNVENSTLSTGNTYDILKRTPGVIIVQGEIMIKNQPATVYINDRKVYLTSTELQQLLEGFSGENVQAVEVITTPPAKYDAEGGVILNIITNKDISVGYKGSVNASNTVAILPKYNAGLNQYYKNNWVNIFAGYNYSKRHDYKKDEGYVEFFKPNTNQTDSKWFTDFEKDSESDSHNLNTIMDFKLSENSQLSLSATLQFNPKIDSDIDGLTEIYGPQGNLDSLFTTESRLENTRNNILLSTTYTKNLGENGATLTIGGNYINYDDDQTQDLMTQYLSGGGNLLNENSFYTIASQNSNVYTANLDISTPLNSLSFETGLKYSGVNSISGLDFFNTNSNPMLLIQALSDELDYNENIYAAYVSLSRDWEKWSIKTGLRGEYTDIEGVSNSQGLVNTQQYLELFPTAYLMYTLDENNSFILDYNRRIIRPRFQSLNPYRYFLNENNFREGNPNLKPGISNKINLNYSYAGKLSLDLYWERTNNPTAVLTFQDNENRFLRTLNDNMDFDQQFSLDLSYYSYLKDWWYLYAYGSLFYLENEFFARESSNQIVNKNTFSTYLQVFNQFTLSEDRTFTADLSTIYLPNFVAGSYTFAESQFNVSIGFSKTFFDSRLVTTLNIEDIFNTYNIPLESRYLNQNNSFFAMPESRSIRFGLIYKFGNFKLSDNNRPTGAEEEERLKEKSVL